MLFEPAEFFHFLKRPHYQILERKKTNIFFTALKIYLLSLLILGLINSLSIILLRTFITLPIDETLVIPDSMKEYLWIYFLLLVIFSPFMEEVIFRLSLIFDPVYLSLSISTPIALIIHKISNGFLL